MAKMDPNGLVDGVLALVSTPDATGFSARLRDFSTKGEDSSANDLEGNRFLAAEALTRVMESQPRTFLARSLPDLGIAVKSILAFWILYMVLITIRGVVIELPGFWELLQRRTLATMVGALLTFLVYLALRPMAVASLNKKAIVASLLCLPASVAFASFNYFIFYIYSPLDAARMDESKMAEGSNWAFQMIAESALSWYFLFIAWAAFYIAMSYAAQLRASDRRAAAFAREAQEAQLRALRYQINPHFLFNTLNSLSSLILSQRTVVAERMIMNLSTFFRTTLSADPTEDIALEGEIQLQRLYLDIEQVRFPDRLKIEIDVPDALRSARVPILILQPVVENAIKYGVARTRGPVTLRIIAYEEDGCLHLKVKDDGRAASEAKEECAGTGVGLRNVCERLITRYGIQAGCFHGPDPGGGYAVHLVMPMVRDV